MVVHAMVLSGVIQADAGSPLKRHCQDVPEAPKELLMTIFLYYLEIF